MTDAFKDRKQISFIVTRISIVSPYILCHRLLASLYVVVRAGKVLEHALCLITIKRSNNKNIRIMSLLDRAHVRVY